MNTFTTNFGIVPPAGAALLQTDFAAGSSSTLQRALKIYPGMLTMRRTIHAQPEAAFEEFETVKRASDSLQSLGYRIVRCGIAGTGLYADLGEGQQAVAIRTEMAAFPVSELNNQAYRSRQAQLMHACGHDAHVAIILGAAELLAELKLPGRVRIILQAGAESRDASAKTGSAQMIAAAALDDVGAVLGFHVDATLSAGKLAVIEGPLAEFGSTFEIICRAEQESLPSITSDLLPKLLSLGSSQQWRSSKLEILAINSDAEKLSLKLDAQFKFDAATKEELLECLNAVCKSVTVESSFEITVHPNSLFQKHMKVIETLMQSSRNLIAGSASLVKRRTWTKEFADYAEKAPAAFLLIGAQVGTQRLIHQTGTFDIDERIMPVAAAALADTVTRLLPGSAGFQPA